MDARGAGVAGLAVAAGLVWAPGATGATVAGDFDRDGHQDLIVGSPGDDVAGFDRAGSAQVFYGTADGPGFARDKIWTKESPGIAGQAIEGDAFGSALAIGDIDCDRFADLAIGAPAPEVGGEAGTVQVIYGGPNGLTKQGDELAPPSAGGGEAGDSRGAAVAVGDFDGDGCADVAGGEPGAPAGTASGRALVWYGSPGGLDGAPDDFQQGDGLEGTQASGEVFASVLAAGDLDGDGRDDLSIGVPLEAVGGDAGAGAVSVIYGARGGLTRRGDQVFTQDSSETIGPATFTLGAAEPSDAFGGRMATGDVNGDGAADLAVAAPLEDIGMIDSAGSANMIYGSPRGLSLEDSQVFNQDSLGPPGAPIGNPSDFSEASDLYGAALAIGDVNGDGFGDALASHRGEAPGSGAVTLLRGSPAGLVTAGNQVVPGDTMYEEADLESVNGAGSSLATGRFNRDKRVDVAVGAFEASGLDGVTEVPVSGAVAVLFGPTFDPAEHLSFDRGSSGVAGQLEPFATFGEAVGVTAAP